MTFDAIVTLQYSVAGKTRSSWTSDQLAEIAPFEGVAVTVTGYMAVLKPQTGGTGESTNCHWTHATEVDWHIALTKSAKEPEPGAIVVETTPRVRKDHPNWTPAAGDVNHPRHGEPGPNQRVAHDGPGTSKPLGAVPNYALGGPPDHEDRGVQGWRVGGSAFERTAGLRHAVVPFGG